MSLLGLQRVGSGPPLVWLHGFTQTKDSGHYFRSILAGSYEVITIDLPGHGKNASITASLSDTAALLAEVLPTERFTLGGYSMGGRVALHLALALEDRVSTLVVVSATMGIRDERERSARLERDRVVAARIEQIGTDAFLDEWLAQPMFRSLGSDVLERAARSRDATGLASSLRYAGTGTQSWLEPDLRALPIPALVVAGANDAKFVNEAHYLAGALAHASTSIVANAGHAAHLEQPNAVASLVVNLQTQ